MKPYRIPEREVIDPDTYRDPYAQIERIREQCPVAYDSVTASYLVVSHDGVDSILRDTNMGRDPRKANPGTRFHESFSGVEGFDANFLFLDPPQHTRLRNLVRRWFTPRAAEEMRSRAQAHTNDLLKSIAEKQHFDVITMLARPLSTLMIAEVLGIEAIDLERFGYWSDQVARGFDPFLSQSGKEEVARARTEFVRYLELALEARRTQPKDDLISELAVGKDADEQPTDYEIITTCRLLLGAGNITTTSLIGNAVLALLTHPEERARLDDRPELIANAIEEVLRYDSPVTFTIRIPPRDVEIQGCPMAKGESLMLSLSGANRDPARYADPDKFHIERDDLRHHAFGGGIHYCLGAHLARVEAQVAVGTLFKRFPGIALNPREELRYGAVPGFRGLETLPVVVP